MVRYWNYLKLFIGLDMPGHQRWGYKIPEMAYTAKEGNILAYQMANERGV